MSKCNPENARLIKDVIDVAKKFHNVFDVSCYYDASQWCTKRDYVLFMEVYPNWDSIYTKWLKEEMRSVGATAIIGGIQRKRSTNYSKIIEICFDEKEKKNVTEKH